MDAAKTVTQAVRSAAFSGLAVLLSCLGCGGSPTSGPPAQSWARDAANPVVTGNGVDILQGSDPSVIFDGGRYRMWYASVGSVPTFASIAYAESIDGSSWTTPAIVFSPSATGWDDQRTEIPSVLRDDTEPDPAKRYKMWYGGSDQAAPDLTKIGYAYSQDGTAWTRVPAAQSPFGNGGLVIDPGSTNVAAEPSVLKKDGLYHMWYGTFGVDELVIHYATSPDGVNWTDHSANPALSYTPGSWEAGGLGMNGTVVQPTVLWDASAAQFKMWYGAFDNTAFQTLAGLGFATSTDGITWTKLPDPVFVPDFASPGEEIGISTGPSVVQQGVTLHLWYAGADASAERVINHATSQ